MKWLGRLRRDDGPYTSLDFRGRKHSYYIIYLYSYSIWSIPLNKSNFHRLGPQYLQLGRSMIEERGIVRVHHTTADSEPREEERL